MPRYTADPADRRRPVDPCDFPKSINGPFWDDHGVDYYIVHYPRPVKGRDGVMRKSVKYMCRKRKTPIGSQEHMGGQNKALVDAWAHCDLPPATEPEPWGRGPAGPQE